MSRRQAERAPVSASGGQPWSGARSERLLLALVGGAILAYLMVFYAVPLPTISPADGPPMRRFEVLHLLLLPEVLVEGWLGDEPGAALVERLPLLTTAAMIWLVGIALGWQILHAAGVLASLRDRLERVVFSAAVGMSGVSLYVLLAGLAGWLHRGVFLTPALVVAGLAAWLAWRGKISPQSHSTKRELSCEANEEARDRHWPSVAWWWLAVPFALAIVLGSALPPVDFDVREYHLQGPKEFFQQGRIGFLPHNVYANMALGSEMFSLLGMVLLGDWWWGGLVGKCTIGGFALLTAAALLAAGRRFFTPGVGVAAVLLYLSIPWVYLVSTSGLVEGVAACYWLLAVYAVLLAWQSYHWRHAALIGFLAGSAVSMKYPAALFVVVPIGAWLIVMALRPSGVIPLAAKRIAPLAAFGLAVLVACGPWFAKNWVLTGNPTYPLLGSLFDSGTWTAQQQAQWHRAHAPPNYSPADAVARLAEVGWRSEWLSPLVLPLAVLTLWRRRREPIVWRLAGYVGVVLVLWWLFTHRIDRFWVPALPIAALLAAAGMHWSNDRLWRRGFLLLLILGLSANFVFMTSGASGLNRFLVRYEALREELLPDWYHYLNEAVPPDRAVLAVGDAAVYELTPEVLYNTTFDASIFETWVRPAYEEPTPQRLDELHRRLAGRVSHVYVHWGEIRRYRSQGNYGFTDFVQPEVFAFLVEQKLLDPPLTQFAETPVQIFAVRTYGDADNATRDENGRTDP